MKGQVAFESLFLMLVVISAGVAITSMYLQTHEVTMALTIAKEETIKQLAAKDSFVLIKKIDYNKTSASELSIDIYLEPLTQLDTNSIKSKILTKTTFTTLNIYTK